MFLLPSHLKRLFKKKKREEKRSFAFDVSAQGLVLRGTSTRKAAGAKIRFGPGPVSEQEGGGEFEIYPEDSSAREQWFSLTIREREVAALVCMGYRNYEIASVLGIGYQTVQTHLQNIFYKSALRSRKELRAALKSWPAEEWWRYHHH